MSDEPSGAGAAEPPREEPPEAAASESTPPPPLPPLPEIFDFPVQLLQQWIEIPDDRLIVAPLTKQDINYLLFGLLRDTEALTALEQTIVHWSNGRNAEANTALSEARRLNIESKNYIRRFFTGLMISALRPDKADD